MRRTLLVQTAFAYHQVIVWADDRVEKSFLNEQTRETLQFLMKVLGEIGDVSFDRIIFVQGPGSFTALRIGATWVNTLAYAKSLPVYNVTTLDYLGALLQKKIEDIAFTFDDKRFFLGEGKSIVETNARPNKDLLYPDQQVIPAAVCLPEDILQGPVPMTDVLYVVPPKITLKK